MNSNEERLNSQEIKSDQTREIYKNKNRKEKQIKKPGEKFDTEDDT